MKAKKMMKIGTGDNIGEIRVCTNEIEAAKKNTDTSGVKVVGWDRWT